MNKLLIAALSLVASITNTYAYPTARMFEITGLPQGEEIDKALSIGLPILLAGVLVWWAITKMKLDNVGWLGCLGPLIILVALIFLLPLWVWVEYIFVNLMDIVLLLTLIILAIIGIIKLFRKIV